jgi:hypothetical protein
MNRSLFAVVALILTSTDAWATAASDCAYLKDLERNIRACTQIAKYNPIDLAAFFTGAMAEAAEIGSWRQAHLTVPSWRG